MQIFRCFLNAMNLTLNRNYIYFKGAHFSHFSKSHFLRRKDLLVSESAKSSRAVWQEIWQLLLHDPISEQNVPGRANLSFLTERETEEESLCSNQTSELSTMGKIKEKAGLQHSLLQGT